MSEHFSLRKERFPRNDDAKTYDVTTKSLLEDRPEDWLRLLEVEGDLVEIVDADLSTVVAEADKALLLSVAGRELLNIEFQSGYEADMIERFLEYSVLFFRRKNLPVRTVVVLLRPQADRPSLTGLLELKDIAGETYLSFHYRLLRLWTIPVERLLGGGLGTLPLAPLADLSGTSPEQVIAQMNVRFRSEASAADADKLWASTYLLMGLRYSAEMATRLTQGVRGMEESTTYQAILERGVQQGAQLGAINEARANLLRIGTKRFGAPSGAVATQLSDIADKERLEELMERALDVETWAELLR